jgi:UDP-N-acetyl-D-glucosamine dehydrogenase
MTASALSTSSLTAELKLRIQRRTAAIGVIGLGYVGLPLVLLYSKAGFPVTGFDVDAHKVDCLARGDSYIHRILPADIRLARSRGFSATTDYSSLNAMDAVLVCVPTPLNEHREPDMSYIVSTMRSIAPHLREGQLIVLESTTYPGTTDEVVLPILEKHNRRQLHAHRNEEDTADCFFAAFSPEREDPGNTAVARHAIPKVVGGVSHEATELACTLYGSIFDRTVPVSTPAAAEMTKLLENIYRCVNIAMVNELKLLCMRMGIDIWEVIDAASTKPFGFQAFFPGPGLGGHCIPVDPYYLSWKARELDFNTRFIELAGDLNGSMPYHVVESITSALNHRDQP